MTRTSPRSSRTLRPRIWGPGFLGPIVATALLTLSLSAGCGGCDDDDPMSPEESLYEANTAPEAVLRNLRVAYEERDFGAYDDLFDRDNFIFKFAQVDVEGADPLPSFWDWADEELATRGMFSNGLVKDIDLEFTLSPLEDPDPNQIDDIPADSKMIFLTSLTLVVTQDNPDLGEQDIFIVDGDRHEFFFREFPEEQVEGESTWKIVEWRDKSLGAGNRVAGIDAAGRVNSSLHSRFATHETTWGKVKTLFE